METPGAAVRNASWLPGASPGRAPDPPTPWQLGNVGRQEVWKQTRENRIHIRERVFEEGKKMCVNCMMKCKPLVLNEKSESGPKPAEGLGVPGVCGEQLEEVRGQRRDTGHGRPVPWRADRHSREKAGAAPGFKEIDLCSQQCPPSRIWNFLWPAQGV